MGLCESIVTTTQMITLGISSILEGPLTSFLPVSPATLQQDMTGVVTESPCSWASEVEAHLCSILHLAFDDALVCVVRVCFTHQWSVLQLPHCSTELNTVQFYLSLKMEMPGSLVNSCSYSVVSMCSGVSREHKCPFPGGMSRNVIAGSSDRHVYPHSCS